MPWPEVFGWDVGGAHLKACRTAGGRVFDVVLWACPLWQGLPHLDAALQAARQRWPRLQQARHAVTMSGEMADLFAHREDGVRRIAAMLAQHLAQPQAEPQEQPQARPQAAGSVQFFAGDAGWCNAGDAAARWPSIASANWLATALHAARQRSGHGAGAGAAVLIDIGSTTTDLIALRGGRVLTRARSDAERLASGELVYQGVARTPLCALAPRIAWRGRPLNVMNELFATAADVYRLTGELDPAHDLHASADNAGKDLPATQQRLARMIGMDAREGSAQEWLDFARAWRACQLQELGGQLQRVLALHGLGRDTHLISAGCGDFLVPELAALAGLDHGLSYGAQLALLAPGRPELTRWAQVCAPCIAVASLLHEEPGRCGS